MAACGFALAIMWALQGQNRDALFAGLVALLSVGFVALAGWIRTRGKKAAEFFPPEVR